jgi:hypothetical protein
MRRRPFGDIYVVEALKEREVEDWAAATLKEKAVAAVAKQVRPDWIVRLLRSA